MTTKTKAKAEAPDPRPEATVVSAPISAPAKPGFNDRREDGAPVIGHFVEVTKGEDKGFFGVLQEVQEDTAVVRGHTNPLQRVSCPFEDLEASELHRR